MEKGSFNHSVKVPKLYKCAAKISQEVAGGVGSIKQLVYEKKHFNTKALYALVVTTFQKATELNLLLKRTKLLEKETRLDPWLAKILISELLWGKTQLPRSDAKPILTILAYEQAFRAHLSDSSWDNYSAKPPIQTKPRYIRINTLKTPFNEALELFEEEGWTLLSSDNDTTYKSFLEQVSSLEGNYFLKDFHIPELLIFPSGTEFFSHPGYKNGAISLQDKASCLPVHILSPPPGSVVLDMCAAPGMKTTQLAAALEDNGTVYAVERDPKRFEVLEKMVEKSGATCVKTVNQDVLQCGDSEFSNVEYLLVDPSCSGSGMTDRLESNPSQDSFRLQRLAGFQIKILRSALTRYPTAKKVVYSTCSLHPEENEDVVRQVLETNNQFKLVPAQSFLNKEWANFGSPDFGNIGKYCLYARPDEDLTNGFFLAVFERLNEGEDNEFYNGRVLNYRRNMEQKQARRDRKNKDRADNNSINEIDNINANTLENVDKSDLIKKKKSKKKKESHDQTFKNINISVNKDEPEKKKRKHAPETSCISDEPENKNMDQDNSETNSVKKHKKKKREDIEDSDKHLSYACDNECVENKHKTRNANNSTDEKAIEVIKNQRSDVDNLTFKNKKSKKKKHLLEAEKNDMRTDLPEVLSCPFNDNADKQELRKKKKKKIK